MKSLSVRNYSQTRRPWHVFQLHANAVNKVQLERGQEASGPSHIHSEILLFDVKGKKNTAWNYSEEENLLLTGVWILFEALGWKSRPRKKIRRGVVIWRNERFLETLMPRLSFFRGVVLMNARDPFINTPWKLCSDKVIMKSWKPRN